MKIITAIIRPEKLNEVLEALFRAEVTGLSISRVQGHGGELHAGASVLGGLRVSIEFPAGGRTHA